MFFNEQGLYLQRNHWFYCSLVLFIEFCFKLIRNVVRQAQIFFLIISLLIQYEIRQNIPWACLTPFELISSQIHIGIHEKSRCLSPQWPLLWRWSVCTSNAQVKAAPWFIQTAPIYIYIYIYSTSGFMHRWVRPGQRIRLLPVPAPYCPYGIKHKSVQPRDVHMRVCIRAVLDQ